MDKQPFKRYLIAARASYIINEGVEEARILAEEILDQIKTIEQKKQKLQSEQFKKLMAELSK